MRLLIIAFLSAVVLVARAVNADNQTRVDTLGFIALGDAGLHLDWYDPDDIGFTYEQFVEEERLGWVEDNRPMEAFRLPPLYEFPGTKFVVEQPGQFATARAIENWCRSALCQFMIVLGDNIYPDGADGSGSEADQQRLMDILETPYKDIGRDQPDFRFYAALGNHDWYSSRRGRDAQIEFGARDDTRYFMEPPGFYTFRRAGAQFWVLDTEMLLAGSVIFKDSLDADGREVVTTELDPAPEWAKPQTPKEHAQLEWLAKGMAKSDARWKFVYGHHTLWSAGGTKYTEAKVLRPLLLPILCRYADAWFNGHEHDLGVFSDSCESVLGTDAHPLPIIVSGAGAKQRAVNSLFHAYQEATYPSYEGHWMKGMTWGFAHVLLEGDKGAVRMITTPNDQSGEPVQEYVFELSRRSGLLTDGTGMSD